MVEEKIFIFDVDWFVSDNIDYEKFFFFILVYVKGEKLIKNRLVYWGIKVWDYLWFIENL